MNNNACIYLIATDPIFNVDLVNNFYHLDKKHSSLLYTTLYLNLFDNIKNSDLFIDIFPILNINDKEFLTDEFWKSIPLGRDIFSTQQVTFLNSENYFDVFDELIQKNIENYAKQIIVNRKIIGLTNSILNNIYNLLCFEDDILVVGKTNNHKVGLIGYSSYKDNFIKIFNQRNLSYKMFLKSIGRLDNFLYEINNLISIDTFDDFKNLYKILSNKESIDFCNNYYHEKFTQIFIEYKELL